MQHTTLCFVRTKSFPLWKVNTTVLTNQRHTALCEKNEWYSHSHCLLKDGLVGISQNDASKLIIQAIWFLTQVRHDLKVENGHSFLFWRCQGLEACERSDAILRCWKSDEREMEWRGMGTHSLSTFIAEANDTNANQVSPSSTKSMIMFNIQLVSEFGKTP